MSAAAVTAVRAALTGADGSLHGILDPRRIVRWIYAARLILVTAIFLAMVVSWRFAPVTSTLVASLALAIAMAFTAASALYSEIYRKPLARTFLYLQSSFDLLLVTAISVDYAILMREQVGGAAVSLLGTLLAALTTWLSFGLLAVSSTPAVSNFGLSVSLGLAFSFMLAPWAGRHETVSETAA